MNRNSSEDRRRDPRLAVTHPVKVWCPMTQKYLAGRTCNLSSSGAMLELDHPSLLVPGQRIRLGIDSTQRQAILASRDMLDGTVVRSLGHGGRQTIAMSFDQRLPLAVSA